MEIELFKVISQALNDFGIVNVLVSIFIVVVLGYGYRNKTKSNKMLEDTVKNQNESIIDAIDNQNILLVEVQRTVNSVMEAMKEVSGKVDGFMTLVVGLVQRDVVRPTSSNVTNTNIDTNTNKEANPIVKDNETLGGE